MDAWFTGVASARKSGRRRSHQCVDGNRFLKLCDDIIDVCSGGKGKVQKSENRLKQKKL